jgi:hypothetical protein
MFSLRVLHTCFPTAQSPVPSRSRVRTSPWAGQDHSNTVIMNCVSHKSNVDSLIVTGIDYTKSNKTLIYIKCTCLIVSVRQTILNYDELAF